MISRRRSASSMNWRYASWNELRDQPYAPAGAIHGEANSWARRAQFMRSRNSLLNVSCETHDRFNMGQDSKRYIFVSKTGVVSPKGIFLFAFAANYFLEPLHQSMYSPKNHNENNNTEQNNQIIINVWRVQFNAKRTDNKSTYAKKY